MHYYQSEAYTVLSVFLFLSEYSKFFKVQLINIPFIVTTKKIVKKVKKKKTKTEYFKPSYKMSEHEVIIAIQNYLSTSIRILFSSSMIELIYR